MGRRRPSFIRTQPPLPNSWNSISNAITAIGAHGDLVVIAGTVRYVDDNRRVLVWTGLLGPGSMPG